ncbi:MAG: pentapeptide repeat-containing protein, partial [Myxococcota bacterium]
LENRFPYYAEDFDWRHFQAAPADQWIKGFWKGDESLVLTNLHPEHPVLEMQLPGLRIRAFVNDDRAAFREVEMMLDTIFIHGDESYVTLTWRGLTPVRKRLATDVKSVLFAQEALTDRPESVEVYRDRLAAFEADPLQLDERLPKEMKQMLAELEDKTSAGDDEVRSAEVQRIADRIQEAIGGVEKEQQAVIINLLERKVQEDPNAAGALRAALDSAEGEADAVPPYVPGAAGARPRAYVRQELSLLYQQLEPVRRGLQHMLAEAPPGKKPAVQAKLDHVEGRLEQLKNPDLLALDPTLRYVDRTGDVDTSRLVPGADLTGEDLSERDFRGIDLRGATLDGAVLTKANLQGANLAGASLKGTVLYRANLRDAHLKGADLSLCNAAAAELENADLAGCNLFEAYFKGAHMQGAMLARAYGRYAGFVEAQLQDASFTEANLPDADFREADFTGANFSGVTIHKGLFYKAKGRAARFNRAELDHSTFIESELSEASFSEGRGERTSFLKSTLDKAHFDYASMPSAFFDQSKAPGANFFAADLKDARFCQAVLNEASFEKANLF